MNPWETIFLDMGVADVQAFLNYVVATSKTGPIFKAAASNALSGLTALATAAQNPSQ